MSAKIEYRDCGDLPPWQTRLLPSGPQHDRTQNFPSPVIFVRRFMSTSLIKPGVVTGEALDQLLANANQNNYAMPAVNVVNTHSINAVLEAAAAVNSPVMIQFSNGGGSFFAGKSLSNDGQQAAIAGCVSGAHHVHQMAEHYGVPVVLHTDHCAKKLLPWIDGLMDAGEKHFEQTGKPLYSSHMLDLSLIHI